MIKYGTFTKKLRKGKRQNFLYTHNDITCALYLLLVILYGLDKFMQNSTHFVRYFVMAEQIWEKDQKSIFEKN